MSEEREVRRAEMFVPSMEFTIETNFGGMRLNECGRCGALVRATPDAVELHFSFHEESR